MSPLGHNFACVAYFYTVASFWFREQLYSLNVVGFIFLFLLGDLVVFFFFVVVVSFCLCHQPLW